MARAEDIARMEQRLMRVQQAARSNLTVRMEEHERKIIQRMVTAFRSGTLTSEILWGSIAAISELRLITMEAEHDLMNVEADSENLQTGA